MAMNYDEFAFFNPDVPIAEFHAESAFDDQKHFVLVFVVMEDELTLQLVQLDVLAVQFSSDVRLPVFVDLGKFLCEIDFVHVVFQRRVLQSLLTRWDSEDRSCRK